jgi:hypothetical protein
MAATVVVEATAAGVAVVTAGAAACIWVAAAVAVCGWAAAAAERAFRRLPAPKQRLEFKRPRALRRPLGLKPRHVPKPRLELNRQP